MGNYREYHCLKKKKAYTRHNQMAGYSQLGVHELVGHAVREIYHLSNLHICRNIWPVCVISVAVIVAIV